MKCVMQQKIIHMYLWHSGRRLVCCDMTADGGMAKVFGNSILRNLCDWLHSRGVGGVTKVNCQAAAEKANKQQRFQQFVAVLAANLNEL